MCGQSPPSAEHPADESAVMTLADLDPAPMQALLDRYGLTLNVLAPGAVIPGSYWGDSEAGLIGRRVLARPDTPVHSILHETCHYICMSPARRRRLDTDAGGDYREEDAVCYLQILLADHLPGISRQRMMSDMDAWGYSFRLGSARAWFEQDAIDALAWLQGHRIVDHAKRVSWRLRSD